MQIIDKAPALERMGGDEELYNDMVQLFLEDAPIQLGEIGKALASSDRETVQRLSHALKSASATIGADQFRDLAFQIERAAMAQEINELAKKLSELEQKLQAVREYFA